jgi:hypothetical protein
MSRQQRGGGGSEVARGAGYAAFLGAVLIGVAVIIGIVLLQIGDKNDNGPKAGAPPKSTTTTTTPKTETTTHTGTTKPSTPQLSPSEVKIIVLNGGAQSGKASAMSVALAHRGYTNHGVPTDWTGHVQTGDSVYCRAGLEREGARLATLVGSNVPLHIPYPSTGAPPTASSYDCTVVVGATGSGQ